MQRPPPRGYNGRNFYLLRNLTFPMVLRRFTPGRALWVVGLLTVGLLAAALGGCGQKGSLYLPDQPPPQIQSQSDCRTPTCAAAAETAVAGESEPENQEEENTAEETTAEETIE